MADTSKDTEDSPIRGFSIVDSLPSNTATSETEETPSKTEDVMIVVKDEDSDVSLRNAEITDEDTGVGEEKATSNRDTIVLDEADRRDDKELNQSTLIITTEDLLDSTIIIEEPIDAKEDVKVEKKSPEVDLVTKEQQSKVVKPKLKREDQNYFWVSNISRQVKAADLKKFFSQVGKVLTAKIVTNGRNYFGYVSMNSGELAAKCIKQLNDTPFDGKKIVVTKDRPDVRDTKSTVKIEPKKKNLEKPEPKKEPLVEPKKEKATELKPASIDVKDKKALEDVSKYNDTIADLRKKLDRAKTDANRYKLKVIEFQRRHDGMRKKCETVERELKENQYKMRNERRRLNQDREQFEKTKKLEQIRFDADRAVVNRELDEVKKLREHLKEKIEELKSQTKKVVKKRSRSPVVRARNIRVRSPPLRNTNSNTFRPEERVERKRKHEDISRGRTPPPPPKLNEVVGKKRSDRGPEASAPSRSYFGESEKRSQPLSQDYEFRHKAGYGIPADDYRGHWPNVFPKDPRRVGSGPSSSQSYPPEVRFAGYQFPSSSASAPSRSYYPDFGKPYGPY